MQPLVHLQPGEARSFRYSVPVRYAWVLGVPFGIWLLAHAQVFEDEPPLQAMVIVAAVMMIIGPLLMRTQVYRVSEAGVTSHNVFQTKTVRWEHIEWVSLDHKLLSGQRYCIYTSRDRRWAYPKLAIPNWVERFDELMAFIRDKVLTMKGGT